MKWCMAIALGFCFWWLPELVAEEAPTFSEPSAMEQFSTGKELFTSGEWKEAQKQFQACQKKTDRAGKKIIKGWIEACKGGLKLVKIEKTMARKNWRGAHAQLGALRGKYGETPLVARLDELIAQVEGELFVILATFEKPAPAPEAAASGVLTITDARINKDPKFVKTGAGSLRWNAKSGTAPGSINYLALARFDIGTLDEMRFLHLSIYNPDEVAARFTLIFDLDNLDELAGAEPMQARMFHKELVVSKLGWSDLRIDLRKDLSTFAKVDLEEVQGVGMRMSSTKPKTVYVDDVKFER